MVSFGRMVLAVPARYVAVGLCLCGFAAGAAENGKIVEQRSRWLEKAEAAKPRLFERTVAPIRIVDVVANASAFQGWGVKDGKPIGEVLSKPLADGASFIVDFGEHLVGTVSL